MLKRIIDVNLNRVSEGLRVIEDITRFYFEEVTISKKCKELRHELRDIQKSKYEFTINYRDSTNDIGLDISKDIKSAKEYNLQSILKANIKRVQEGLRSLEEITGLNNFENLRYKSYDLEQRVFMLMKRNNFSLPDIYGITHSKASLGRSNIEIVNQMLIAGIKIIQYREKDLSMKEMLKECLEIRKLTTQHNATFIINDFSDLVLLTNADGIHIGQDDIPIESVRKILGNKIIGLSTHNPTQAIDAVNRGADYIGVGPIHKTNTKINVCEPVGYEYLEWVEKNIYIPYVAIGGIKESNLFEIVQRGAKSVSLVSEITESENIVNKVEKLRRIMGEYNYV
ncbi:MAG: thiamine phosphate synthase [Spirochaetales bacterium]|nr:thiamine phosphate synthase [Spirochaetales bacterium]